MAKRNESVLERVYGVGPAGRRRDRGALLLSSALGCSLLIAATPGAARAQSISQTAEGDITITQEVVNGAPFGVDVISDLGNVTIDIGQVNVTNNGTGSGYGISAVTFAPDKLISISVDETTATGAGRIFGVVAQAPDASSILINAGAIEATGDGGYGIWGATGSGAITITAGSVSTTGGVRVIGEELRPSYGVWALTESGPVSVTSGSITTAGLGAAGVMVQNVAGDVTVDSGAISTAEDLAAGVNASGHDITVTSDEIETLGDGSPGIYVPVASGDVTIGSGTISTAGGLIVVEGQAYISPGIAVLDGENVTITSDQITTTGGGGFGIAVEDVGTISIVSGQINTTGDAATGITAGADGAISIVSESITTVGEPVEFEGVFIYAEGIFAETNGPITIDSGAISTQGVLAYGILTEGGEGATAIVSDSISTAGVGAAGVLAQTTTGDVTIDSGVVSTTADLSAGLHATGRDITISSDEITTVGDGSPGIYVPVASGDVTIDSGTISTAGGLIVVEGQAYISPGIAVLDSQNVTITSDQITTTGDGAFGIAVEDVATISITSGQINTSGAAASGITAGADGAITITSESITTAGEPVFFDGVWVAGEGIFAETNGPIIIDSGAISTQGALGHGIFAEGGAGAISINSGTVTATGDSAHGILATATSGDIAITAGSTATSGDYIADDAANPYDYYPDAITALTDSGNISITSQSTSADGMYSSAIVAASAGGGDIAINSVEAVAAGDGGVAIYAVSSDGPGGDITVVSGGIVSSGDGAGALTAVGSGDVTIQSGSIVSTGAVFDDPDHGQISPTALYASSSHGDVSVASDSISTSGDRAVGILAIADTGGVSVASGSITTQSARGIMVEAAGAITIDSGSIHSAVPEGGAGAHAIMVTAGDGAVNLASDEIVVEGPDSHGVYVANAGGDDIAGIGGWREATGGTGALTIDSGSIDSSGWGMMIDHQGAIDITSDSIVSEVHGIYLYGSGAITIDSGAIETRNGVGIVAWGDEGAVSIDSGQVLVGEGGDVGVFARTTSGDIVINAGQTTTTATGLIFDSYAADAVGAASDTGNITIVSGSATTAGLYSSGVWASTGGDISITSGSVANSGEIANGIAAFADGAVSIDSGSIDMSGPAGWGIYVEAGGPVTVASDSIAVTGEPAGGEHGLGVVVFSRADVQVDSGAISTVGDDAFGIGVTAAGEVTIASGSVATNGTNAAGIVVTDAASAKVTTGDVTAAGADSAGVVVVSRGAAEVTVDGDVTSAESFGVIVEAGADSTIDIAVTSGASVSGALGAIALNSDTDATLNIAGRVSSEGGAAVLLRAGDDVVNLGTGADIEGALDGGAGIDALNLNSTINVAGASQTLDDVVGFETMTVTNGRWTLQGAASADTAISGGTLVVTGALTDDLVVAQGGTLQIGDGGTTGTLIGDLVIDGTVIFDRSDEYDFAGDVSGAGSLVKEGESRLILSGAYDFTGTTVVNGGTIKILQLPASAELVVDDGVLDLSGQEQELASLSGGGGGQVNVDGGALTVNQSGSTTFGGSITGDGSFNLTGGGEINLTGNNTYTGPTTIEEGTLRVNGSITSNVTVDGGGVLGGSGQIGGDVNVGAGGIVGPGNSPGTLTVAGDFTFEEGSTYVAEVEANGDHDQIDVSGATTIEDGVTLQILAGNGDYARLTGYTLLTSASITGEFENIETNLAFLTPHLEYTNTAVQLYLTRNDITFASFAANANQAGVAEVIEAAGIGDPLYDALVVQSAEGSLAGYDALSGEAYASLGSVLLQQSRYGRDAILDRAANAPEGRGAWAQVLGSSLDFAGGADNAGIESEGQGFIAGADMAANGWRVGAAVTHIASDVEAATLASTADVKSTSISAYGAFASGPVKATVGASYGRHDIDAERAVVFPGFADATTADFEATSGELFAEVSVAQQLGGVFLQPFVGVGYATLDVDSFTEEGGDAALSVGATERSVTMAKVGIRASTTFESGLGQVTPFGSVALHGVLGDDDTPMNAAFEGAGAYSVSGAPIDDGVAFDFGVRIDGERLGFTAVYSGMEADSWSDQQARVGVSFRF